MTDPQDRALLRRRRFLQLSAFTASGLWLPAAKILPVQGQVVDDVLLDFSETTRLYAKFGKTNRVTIRAPRDASMRNMVASLTIEQPHTIAQWPSNVLWPAGRAPTVLPQGRSMLVMWFDGKSYFAEVVHMGEEA